MIFNICDLTVNVAGQASWGMNSWYLDNTSEGGDDNNRGRKQGNDEYIDIKLRIEKIGSSRINPGDGFFLFFFSVPFLLFLALAGGSNPAGQSLTLYLPTLTYQKLL